MDARRSSFALATLSLVLFSACSSRQNKDWEKRAPSFAEYKSWFLMDKGPSPLTTLEFAKGRSGLSEESKEHLKKLSEELSETKVEIEEIRVLAWPDKELSESPTALGQEDVALARKRARAVKGFLEERLEVKQDVDAYNMAKSPETMGELFKYDEEEIKGPKASHAFVIIDYK